MPSYVESMAPSALNYESCAVLRNSSTSILFKRFSSNCLSFLISDSKGPGLISRLEIEGPLSLSSLVNLPLYSRGCLWTCSMLWNRVGSYE